MAGALKNYYEILGVPRSASADQIRTAYRKLLLKFHPDKNTGDLYFEDWSKKINEAFEVLMDPQVRSEYDQVFEETTTTLKQAVRTAQAEAAQPSEESAQPTATVDADLRKLADTYIYQKESYIKAKRHFDTLKGQLQQRKMDPMPHFIIGGVLFVALIVWVGFSYKDKIIPKPTAEVVAPVHTEAPVSQSPPAAVNQSDIEEDVAAENVDLWLRIAAPQAYFYKSPDGAKLGDKFLSKGNKMHATKMAGDYYFCTFQSVSIASYRIEGWVKKSEVEVVTP